MEQRNFDYNERRVSYLGDDKMIYIYNCYGGTHSSALAAAYHLKKLPANREPTDKEIYFYNFVIISYCFQDCTAAYAQLFLRDNFLYKNSLERNGKIIALDYNPASKINRSGS